MISWTDYIPPPNLGVIVFGHILEIHSRAFTLSLCQGAVFFQTPISVARFSLHCRMPLSGGCSRWSNWLACGTSAHCKLYNEVHSSGLWIICAPLNYYSIYSCHSHCCLITLYLNYSFKGDKVIWKVSVPCASCTLYTVHWTLYTVYCILYTVYCIMYNVHCIS